MTKKILIDETVVKQALEALESTGRFLHHCWCDVQMNEYSFDKLNKQMEIVDAEITALRGALEVNNKGVNALAEQPDYSICPACGGMAADPIVPVKARQQEPVAWGLGNTAITGSNRWMMLREQVPADDQYGGEMWTPLYTRHQARKPLTDEQIESCLPVSHLTRRTQVWFTKADVVQACRAIEAAHGITSTNKGD